MGNGWTIRTACWEGQPEVGPQSGQEGDMPGTQGPEVTSQEALHVAGGGAELGRGAVRAHW